MNEDYVSYELAKKLKKCGFNGRGCRHFYYVSKDGKKVAFKERGDGIIVQFRNEGRTQIPAATLWHAQKWLREKKGIAINVIAHDGGVYDYDIVFLPNAVDYDYPIDRATFSRTYEEALTEGIEYALELLRD